MPALCHAPWVMCWKSQSEEFLPSSGWSTGHYCTGRRCIFHNPLLLAWYSVGSLSRALGGGFDARLQGLCSHVYSWTARLTELRSLGPLLTLSPERQAVLSLFRFLTYSDDGPAQQAEFTNCFQVGIADDNLKLSRVSLMQAGAP